MISAIEYREFVATRFKRQGSLSADLLHAAIGISGEVQELLAANTRENISEELGDILFYCAAFELVALEAGQRIVATLGFDCSLEHAAISFRNHAGEMLDQCKKFHIYNKPVVFSDSLLFNYRNIVNRVQNYCHILGFDFEAIMRSNYEKLKLHYPEGYSDQAAQERKDKQ